MNDYCGTSNRYAIKALLMLFIGLFMLGLTDLTHASTRRLVLKDDGNQGEQKRYALVIGNSEYESSEVPRLANPTNDAKAMADALNSLNFQAWIQPVDATH